METATDLPAEATIEAAALAASTGLLTHSLSNWRDREIAAGIHPHVFVLFAGTYAAMLLVLWLFFGTDVNAAIALGVSTDYTLAAIEKARAVVLEVNPQLPFTYGNCHVHVSRVTHVVDATAPMVELPPSVIGPKTRYEPSSHRSRLNQR